MRSARYWLPAALWTGLVLYASSDTFSAENTGGILQAIVAATLGTLSPRTFAALHFLVRKCAHLTEYGILSLLWLRAWRAGRGGFVWNWGLAAVGIAVAVAIADEVHQSFVPSRSGEVRDILLDATGALLAQILVWVVISLRGRRPSAA